MDFNLIITIAVIFLALGIVALIIFNSGGKKRKIPPYTQALTFLLTGDKEKALEKLRQVINEDTDNIPAYILYGDILRDSGRTKQAAKIHKELTIRDKVAPAVRNDIYRSLILDYETAKNYKPALACVEEFLSKNKNDIWGLTKKLSILEKIDDWKDALETAKKLQSQTGKGNKAQLAYYKVMEARQLLANHGKDHDVRIMLRSALKIDKTCAWAYLELGDSYIRDNRPEDAISEWKELFKNNPDKAYLCFKKLENTVFELGRFEDLEMIYHKLIKENSQNSKAVVALAHFVERKGKVQQAIQICRDGLLAKPESLWIRRNLFRMLANTKQTEEATKLGLEVIKMVTSDTEEFMCRECGHMIKTPTWLCPKCKKWDSFQY